MEDEGGEREMLCSVLDAVCSGEIRRWRGWTYLPLLSLNHIVDFTMQENVLMLRCEDYVRK